MITQVKAYPRRYMESIVQNFVSMPDVWYHISLYHNPGTFVMHLHNIADFQDRGMRDYIIIKAADETPSTVQSTKKDYHNEDDKAIKDTDEIVLFNNDHAKQIIKFIEKVNEGEDGVLTINCNAGVSRSGAVAVFANEHLKLNQFDFKNNNQTIIPNYYILRILEQQLNPVI